MIARARRWIDAERATWCAIRERWARLERHERRRALVHGGCVAWLSGSFAHEWHAIGQADLAFLVLALVSELEQFGRR